MHDKTDTQNALINAASPTRRTVVSGLATSTTLAILAQPALSQTPPQKPAPTPAKAGSEKPPQDYPAPTPFSFETIMKKARDLASQPYDTSQPALPEPLQKLDYDSWRDIRFKPERQLLQGNSAFHLQLFHLGHLYKRPVIINIIRDGIAAPIPYAANLFDMGRNKFDKAFPVGLGFAGFRLHYPLNDPKTNDELIAFLGASYFRFLGRGQRYGLSARGLALGLDETGQEEFPYFREFWLETPDHAAEHITIYALLDSPSLTGAYRFDVYPSVETTVEISSQLFTRKAVNELKLAPLTSMFLTGKNDRRIHDDFRPQLHDSDGLAIHTGTGEWLWRPLRNSLAPSISSFLDKDTRGFGLLQRDRDFTHYQDLDLAYELRPSYFVVPHENWGEGRIELVELPTRDETNDNIVASFVPKISLEAGQNFAFSYKISALMYEAALQTSGYARNTYHVRAKALGSTETLRPGQTRFIIDFAGGDLEFYLHNPELVEFVPSCGTGRIMQAFLVPNPHINGFRAALDIELEAGQSTDLRAFLRVGDHALTETWTYPWRYAANQPDKPAP